MNYKYVKNNLTVLASHDRRKPVLTVCKRKTVDAGQFLRGVGGHRYFTVD